MQNNKDLSLKPKKTEIPFEGVKIHFIDSGSKIKFDPEFECIVELEDCSFHISCDFLGFYFDNSFKNQPNSEMILQYISQKHMDLDRLYHLDRLEHDLPACDPRWEKDQNKHPSKELKKLNTNDYNMFLAGRLN